MSVTLFVFHLLPSGGMAWLNFAAPLNMFFMVVTRAVSQVPTFWLKALAPSNMPAMSVTLDVFHWLPVVPHALLNAAAPENMFFIVSTLAVSHRDTSPLNFAAEPP